MKKVILCKDCVHYLGGYIPQCANVKIDGATGEREHGCGVERCLPWLSSIIFRMCGKTGRYFVHR